MIESFYDQLAPFYKYIFQDWNASVERHAVILEGVIREYFGDRVHTILDAACGVGTQAIGLAQKGYHLTASDISSAEIERARSEAASRKLKIDFHTADMRSLQKTFDAKFDLVIACDNAVPHLLSDDEILQAFREFYRVTTEAGGCIISVRDYDTLEKGGRRLYPRMVHDIPGGRVVIFDCWDFDGEVYDITMYVVEDTGLATAHTRVIRGGRYYCVSIIKLEELMQKAGFVRVDTLLERYFQPLLVGLKE